MPNAKTQGLASSWKNDPLPSSPEPGDLVVDDEVVVDVVVIIVEDQTKEKSQEIRKGEGFGGSQTQDQAFPWQQEAPCSLWAPSKTSEHAENESAMRSFLSSRVLSQERASCIQGRRRP